jgi:hypothetical protein
VARGGGVHAAGTESAGNGGFLGGNSVSGASSITTNGNIAWTNTGQIEITFSTLPVTWLSFSSTKEGNAVALNWSTASEQNTKDYSIQRSNNTTDWNDIRNVVAAGNSNTVQLYKFVDQNAVNGLNYYRIIQHDLNGRMNYSSIVSFKFTDEAAALKIYPNPVVNGTTMISLKKAGILKLYNSTGAKLMEQEYKAGDHLLILSSLSKGTTM